MFASRRDLNNLDQYARTNVVESVDQVSALWGETFDAGLAMALNEERSDSAHRAYREPYQKRAQAIGQLGGDINLARLYELEGPSIRRIAEDIDRFGPEDAKRRTADPRLVDAVMQAREYSERFPEQVPSDEAIGQQVTETLAEARRRNQSTLERGSGVAGALGGMAGFVGDPLVIATAPLGPGSIVGRGVAGNAARAFLTEGGIALAAEIPIQAEVLRFKAEIDSPWSFKDAAINTLAAAVGAGGLRAAGSATIDTAEILLARYAKVPGPARTAETEAAADILRRAADYEAEAPTLPDSEVDTPTMPLEVHQEATTQARAQMEAGEPVNVADTVRDNEPLQPLDRASDQALSDVQVLEPGEIRVAPDRFQFKAGGDAEGVTSSLADVTEFDQRLAGQILVYEQADGARFVVDGHQRVGLAKRALAGGQDPTEVRLPAFILRETDGVTDIDAMRVGAIRNLTATTGSALDAAKVLRGIGPAGEALLPPLPPNGAVLRQGRFLARLGDDAFNQVVNEIVPERYGAVVGELIHDEAAQPTVINTLARLNPANETQARAMVEQMRTAGFRRQTTEDLFGERDIVESRIKERAQVIDAALRQSRQDRTTFNRLVSRGADIEATGANRLDQSANQQRVQESGQAIETLSRLANQKGPISDAITEAAERVAAGEKPADVVDAVLQAVDRTPAGGDTGGNQARVTRRQTAQDSRAFQETQTSDLEEAIEQAPALQTELRAFFDENGIEVVDPGVKSPDSARSKMTRKAYQDARQMTDLVRFAVLDADADQIIETLAQRYDVLDEGFRETKLGYQNQPLLVRFENGQVGEVQIVDPAMWRAKMEGGGDQLYDTWRNLPDKTGDEAKDLVRQSRELYAKASSGKTPGNDSANRSSSTPTPDSRTSNASTSTQSPPSSTIARARIEDSSTTAGRDSQSTSSISSTSDESLTQNAGNDLFSAPETRGAGRPEEGRQTGLVPDEAYDDVMQQYAQLDEEAGDLVEVSRVSLDERGGTETEIVSARQAMADVDRLEQTLTDIEVCST